MSLRKKSFIVVALVALVLSILIIYVVSELFITRFDRLELANSNQDISRVRETFESELMNLSIKLSDWSSWDDTYNYVRTKDTNYLTSNIQPQTFTSLHLDTIVYVNERRTIVSATSFDADTQKLTSSISGTLEQLLLSSEKFYRLEKNGDEVHGILMVDDRPLMIAARPILTSNGEGPRNGVIFFGRWFQQNLVKDMAFRLKAPLSYEVIGPPESRSKDIKEELEQQKEIVIEPESQSIMEADLFFNDLFGEPILYFHLPLPRDIHAQGLAVTRLVSVVMMVIGIIFAMLILWIIDTLIISRVVRISSSISRLGSEGDLSGRIEAPNQHDEISSLVTTINTTLDSLEASQGQLTLERLRIKQYIDSAGVLFVVLDIHGVVILINNKACSALGKRREECIGKRWFDFAIPREAQEANWQLFSTILTVKQNKELEYSESQIVGINNTIRLIGWYTTVLYDQEGHTTNVLLSGEDITEERENEKSLKQKNVELEATKSAMLNILEDEKLLKEQLVHEKENVERKIVLRTQELVDEKAKLLASINSLNVGYLLTDIHGRVLISNIRMEKMFPRMHQNAPVMIEHLALSLGSEVHVQEEFEQVLRSHDPIIHESVVYGNRYIRLMLIPVVLEQTGEVIGVVFLAEDITERKILDRSRDEFFSIASHELRTPLTAIRGNTSMMLDYFGPTLSDPQLHEMVTDVHESSIRLISIVNDFLNVSRLEQKRISYVLTRVDVAKLSQEVLQEYKVTGISGGSVTLEFKPMMDGDFIVIADKDRLREVLINLVGNSLKFTERGSVTIQVEKHERDIEIQIQDTGRGISPANQSLLFHKFQQATDNLFTRDTTKGTGLGLYISKLMIEGMGGGIRLLKSEVGKGTTMAIRLPAAG